MAATAPERPAGVPEAGFWNPELGSWEISRLNAQGVREGECLFYRRDGSLQSRCGFVAGLREGPFAMFHPDGRVSREGIFTAGRAEGIVSAYPGVGPGAEPLRSCCVPPGAVRLDLRFEEGEIVQEVFYDADGRPILSDGRPWPRRPSGVPEDAEYEETAPQWARRRAELHRFWTEAGVLTSEIEFANGIRRAERTFDAAGQLVEACEFSPDRVRQGAFLHRLPAEGGGAYADTRIREERGTFDRGQAVGTWSFLDAAGAELATVARGVAFAEGDEAASPAFAPGAGRTAEGTAEGTAEDWWTLSRTLRAEGRVREALCAAARAAVREGDRAALERALAADVVALGPGLAAQRGKALEQSVEVKVWSILDALLCGADAASAFRALAAVLPGVSAAAADFVEAALLLAPERQMIHLTRALVRLQRGDEEGTRADLQIVAAESPDAAALLVGQLQAVLRPFDHWPAREPLLPDPLLADVGAGLVRELDELRATVGVYATRIGRLRAAVQALIGAGVTPAWLPPDLSTLLPAGPVALRRAQISVDLADGEGEGETAEVEINEEIATDGLGVPALLGEAQADWGALCWLCWSVGLAAPALPEALTEPPLFAVAMKTIVTRCWRAQDRLKSGGLLARANGVPGFEWQGIDIDALPLHLARTVAEEYLRARSAFLWLASPDVVSPFQIDLRDD